ncbi:MAG: hypothetical protein FWH29_09680 [Methanobrevibacter sp.]|nr:hypothetical protein [Methanobrevibacter sp.]
MSAKKNIELYEIMINNLEKSGFGDNQVQVYKEIIDFIKDCPSSLDAYKKLKSSDYSIAPNIALIKDKLETLKKANLEIQMEEIAKVYADKIEEIDSNPNSTYETTYEEKANEIWREHENKLYGFVAIYNAYLSLIIVDEEDYQFAHLNLINAFKTLNSLNDNFLDLSKNKRFRDIIPINDKAYFDFIKNAQIYKNSPPDLNQVDKNEIELAFKNIKENKSKLEKIAKDYLNQQKASGAISTSPKDKKGKYEYIEILEVDL